MFVPAVHSCGCWKKYEKCEFRRVDCETVTGGERMGLPPVAAARFPVSLADTIGSESKADG
jgi:hypothetical protein